MPLNKETKPNLVFNMYTEAINSFFFHDGFHYSVLAYIHYLKKIHQINSLSSISI